MLTDYIQYYILPSLRYANVTTAEVFNMVIRSQCPVTVTATTPVLGDAIRSSCWATRVTSATREGRPGESPVNEILYFFLSFLY